MVRTPAFQVGDAGSKPAGNTSVVREGVVSIPAGLCVCVTYIRLQAVLHLSGVRVALMLTFSTNTQFLGESGLGMG